MKSIQNKISADFISIPEETGVSEAIQLIRSKRAELKKKCLYVYTVDHEEKLKGVLHLRDLLLGEDSAHVRAIALSNPVCLRRNDSETVAAEFFKKHPFLALPVLDDKGVLIGALSAESLGDLVQIDAKRMLHHFAGLGGEEIEEKSILKIVLSRLPWLILSMMSGLMCAYILGLFVEEIESMIALVLFIPIVLGVAGGVGVQSSVITVRGLKEGRLQLSNIGRVLAKEIGIGLLIGLICCAAVSLIAILWQKDPTLGFALGTSIIAAVVASGILGMLLPLILWGLRMNPELASGLFVLVICDIAVMVIYFSVSFAIIRTPV